MEELIKKSYSDLISSVNLKEAKKEDIINFFISNHNFSEIQSNFATALFLYLSKEYKVPLSKELREIAPSPEENKKYIPKKRGKKKQVYKIKEEAILEDKTEGEGILILIKGNDVNIKLSAKNREELKEIMDNKLPSILPTINLFLSEKKEEDEDEP